MSPGVKRGDDEDAISEPDRGILLEREGVAYAVCDERKGVANCALIVVILPRFCGRRRSELGGQSKQRDNKDRSGKIVAPDRVLTLNRSYSKDPSGESMDQQCRGHRFQKGMLGIGLPMYNKIKRVIEEKH